MTTAAISPGGHRHRRVPFNEMVRFDAMRSADWRWQRAWWHVWEDRRFCPGRDDEATGRAVAFLRASQRCNTKRQFSGLRRRDPDLYAAHALQESQSRTRMEIEARLLAGQSVAEVANRTSLPMAVIEVFEKVFFNVCDSLSATGWVMAHAVGPKFYGVVDAEDFAVVVKGLAYRHGPVLLDAILADVVDHNGRFTTTKASDFMTAEGRLAARTVLFLLPHIARQSNALVLEMDRINELITQIERDEAASPAPGIDLSTIVDSLTMGEAPTPMPDRTDQAALDQMPVEHGEEGQDRHVA
jgi:hypothetical protein